MGSRHKLGRVCDDLCRVWSGVVERRDASLSLADRRQWGRACPQLAQRWAPIPASSLSLATLKWCGGLAQARIVRAGLPIVHLLDKHTYVASSTVDGLILRTFVRVLLLRLPNRVGMQDQFLACDKTEGTWPLQGHAPRPRDETFNAIPANALFVLTSSYSAAHYRTSYSQLRP